MKYVTSTVLMFATCLSLSGCSGGGASAASVQPIEGLDLSGSYRATGLECYDNAGASLTAAATLNSTYTETMVISGNSYTSTSTYGGCITRETGRITYNSTTYVMAISGRQTTTSTIASCTLVWNFTAALGSITPTSSSATVNHNGTPSGLSFSAIRSSSSGNVGLYSIYQRVGAPTDLCFMTYQKF